MFVEPPLHAKTLLEVTSVPASLVMKNVMENVSILMSALMMKRVQRIQFVQTQRADIIAHALTDISK